jgi:hypothetical protein
MKALDTLSRVPHRGPEMRLSPERRYQHDAVFHNLVDTLVQAIENCDYTPTEIREAAVLAAIIHEERSVRRGIV